MKELNKLNCNIIKDLLPSYLEGMCSQDTKNIVDEHLSECIECRRLKKLLHETELITDQTERTEINYIKKLKRHFIKQGFFSTLILAAFILIGFTASIKNSSFTAKTYYAFLPVLLLITRAVIPVPLLHKKIEKKQKITAVISALLTGYVFLLIAVLLYHLPLLSEQSSKASFSFGPFYLMPEQIGPFFDNQLKVIAFLQAVIYVTGLFRTLYKTPPSFFCMGIYLTGAFIALMPDRILKSMTDVSAIYQTMLIPVIFLLLEGACIIFFLSAAEKLKRDVIN